MPPKAKKGTKKAQNGKSNDWSDNEADMQSLNAKLGLQALSDESSDEEEAPRPAAKSKGGLSGGFASLSMQDDNDDDDKDQSESEGEGLMAQMAKAAKAQASAPAPAAKDKKKKKQKQKSQAQEQEDPLSDLDEAQQQGDHDQPKSPAAGPVAVAADDLWASDEDKPKKGKKGKGGNKKQQQQNQQDDDEPAAADEPAKALDENRPLSKKEKEKLKKQRQKEAEKAKKAKQKPQTQSAAATPAEPSSPAEPAAAAAEEDAEDAEPTSTSAKDKKKKKKKGAAKEAAAEPAEPAPDSKPGKAPKVSKAVAAMREQMLARQQAEERAKQAEEERLRKIKEEEEKEEAEKARVEAARLAKKQKQKEKEAQQKAAGTFKTAAQKKAEARAQAQREALLASGQIKIAGMGGDDASPAPAPKKPVYNNKKKQQQQQKQQPKPEEPAPTPEPEASAQPTPAAAEEAEDDLKDSWDVSSEEEKPAAAEDDIKDDWDAESEEEAPAPAPAKPAQSKGKPNGAPAAPQATQSKEQAKATPVPAKAAGKASAAKAKAEESSEEESEEESSEEESGSDEDSSSEEDSSDEESSSEDDGLTPAQRAMEAKKAEMAERKKQRLAAAKAAQSKDDLRSPICCILGHVDTGKTKLLDKIRQTNVQEGEAGGITQQIGATFFPVDKIRAKTKVLGDDDLKEYKLPGLLVIDTPGHESFTNLRTRGSSLCNIAILVVDIVHGLEPQTLESLRLLRDRKTPFVVALNKIDRMYGWKPIPDAGFKETFASQAKNAQSEFKDRLQRTMLEFAEQGLNAVPWYENKDMGRTVSLVPTSAVTGEGVPDMLMLLVKLTQERMSNNLMYLSELECTVLEVKVIEGLGTTIDVVLSNGVLREGDRIVVCGLQGPIVTQVRALLTPQPLKELRIKGTYVHHKEVKAALGIKITAPGLEHAIAGSRLLQVTEDDDEEELKREVMQDLTSLLNSVDKTGKGVWVQASTLGALEALLDFLKSSKIPVFGINIGPVHKKDITRASVMLEKAPEYAVCLCFDVAVDKDAEKMAEDAGIKIFKADIIYHLFDAFVAHNKAVLEAKQRDSVAQAFWPCRLKIIKAFASRDPIILGCDIEEGQLRVGTPLCAVRKLEDGKKELVPLGRVTGLEINKKPFDKVLKRDVGAGVAVKIEHAVYEPSKMFGRHFGENDEIVSMLSRNSIDTLKELFRNDVSKDEWMLIKKLKPVLGID